jgi:hypothetical protein
MASLLKFPRFFRLLGSSAAFALFALLLLAEEKF